MSEALIEQIKTLTLDASKSVEAANIEQCLNLLKQRQLKLEQLQSNFQNDKLAHETFVSVLTWVQLNDAPNIVKLEEHRSSLKGKFAKQSQAKKALKAYSKVK